MNSLLQLSEFLSAAQRQSQLTQAQLADQSGTSLRTIAHVLNGSTDFRVTTLMSIAYCLGYELHLLPRAHVSSAGGAPGPLAGLIEHLRSGGLVSSLPVGQVQGAPIYDDTPLTPVQKIMADVKAQALKRKRGGQG